MKLSKKNRKLYSNLKKKANSTLGVDIKKKMSDLNKYLLPKESTGKKASSPTTNYEEIMNKANAKSTANMNSILSKYKNEMDNKFGKSTDKIYKLEKELLNSNKRFNNLAKGSQKVFNSLGEQIKALTESKAAQPTQQQLPRDYNKYADRTSEELGNENLTVSDNNEVITSDVQYDMSAFDNSDMLPTTSAPLKYSSTVEDKIPLYEDTFRHIDLGVSDLDPSSIIPGQFITFNNYKMKVPNIFGIRSGANAVAGISEKEHSKGIDIRLYSLDNKPIDYPVAVADGTIVKIDVQLGGKRYSTTSGVRSGGYYMYIQLDEDPNIITKYTHMPKDILTFKGKLLGKHIKRGDIIVNSNDTTSGSITAKHVKLSMGSYNPKTGMSGFDYSLEKHNPTKLLLTGKL